MSQVFLQSRLQYIAGAQNTDGGWGYFPGRGSWMEPTFYALVALHGHKEYADHWGRAWRLIRSWQLPDGGVKPSNEVQKPSWSTALWVSLHCIHGVIDQNLEGAVDWLLETSGAEGALWRRVVEATKPKVPGYDVDRYGWSWFPETNSWVEPTVHSLVAMKKMYFARPGKKHPRHPEIKKRVRLGEQMVIDRRCVDGGWNYGARLALGIALPSYPECTGVALLGLQGNRSPNVRGGLEFATRNMTETRSALGKAWLEMTLRTHHWVLPDLSVSTPPPRDLLIAAIQAIGCIEGNFPLLRTQTVVADFGAKS